MYFIEYNKSLKEFSRQLRNNSTLGEVLLWNQIKARKMLGYQFNRQKPLGNYIVDFYCKKLNLVIEVDGSSHDHYEIYINDIKRENILKGMGMSFLRFDDGDVKFQINNILREIEGFILEFNEKNGQEYSFAPK